MIDTLSIIVSNLFMINILLKLLEYKDLILREKITESQKLLVKATLT